MQFVNIHDAKTNLSKYIEKILSDHENIVICKNGVPVCQLVEYKMNNPIKLGLLKGKINIADDFDDNLPDEIMQDYT